MEGQRFPRQTSDHAAHPNPNTNDTTAVVTKPVQRVARGFSFAMATTRPDILETPPDILETPPDILDFSGFFSVIVIQSLI
jgi:hypothetical protein